MLMSVCMRYAQQTFEAEDILHQGFIKIFKYIHTFNGSGSFIGWMKRIVINAAIKHYSSNKKHYYHSQESEALQLAETEHDVFEKLTAEDLMKLINTLPEGYRMIFNLYVVEGYKHREISEMLNISEGTSKSQLAKAKAMLQRRLKEQEISTNKVLAKYA